MPTPHPLAPVEDLLNKQQALRAKLASLTDGELEDYQRLRTLREKYEKADELLGKVLLVLIADLGLKVSDSHLTALQESARGHHPAVQEPAPPPPVYVASRPPIKPRPPEPPASGPQASTPSPATPFPGPLPSGSVPFSNVIGRQVRRGCGPHQTGWFISGSAPQDYRIGVDPGLSGAQDEVAFIQALSSNPRPHAELDRCAEIARFTGKRVRFTAEIRAENVRDYANVHIRGENLGHERLGDPRSSFKGTFDWTPYSVEMDVTPEMTELSYGITFESAGKAWIRRPAFQVLGPIRGAAQ
jgi:hypothetical protein